MLRYLFFLFLIAAGPATRPGPVVVTHQLRHNPGESIFTVTIDLSDDRVSPRACRAGADPDGDGPWETTLLPTTEIAGREKLDVAVNADFFRAIETVDVEGKKTGFVRGKWAKPEGLAVSDGTVWNRSSTTRPAIEFVRGGPPRIELVPADTDPAKDVTQAVGGSTILMRDGKILDFDGALSTARHPRTGVGLDKSGTHLILIVVDGRQPTLSVGMTMSELATEFRRAGADTALNLDGGGSTTLVYRDPATGKLRTLNSPSDTKERSVADVLGFKIDTPLPPVP